MCVCVFLLSALIPKSRVHHPSVPSLSSPPQNLNFSALFSTHMQTLPPILHPRSRRSVAGTGATLVGGRWPPLANVRQRFLDAQRGEARGRVLVPALLHHLGDRVERVGGDPPVRYARPLPVRTDDLEGEDGKRELLNIILDFIDHVHFLKSLPL